MNQSNLCELWHKRMVTDNEGEVDSHKFDDPCQDSEIKKEPSVLYNPQQNGIAEKKSRDVIFHEKDVSRHFREPQNDIDMEVQEAPASESLIHDSSLSDGQREEAKESSVYPIKEPIERLPRCSSFFFISVEPRHLFKILHL